MKEDPITEWILEAIASNVLVVESDLAREWAKILVNDVGAIEKVRILYLLLTIIEDEPFNCRRNYYGLTRSG